MILSQKADMKADSDWISTLWVHFQCQTEKGLEEVFSTHESEVIIVTNLREKKKRKKKSKKREGTVFNLRKSCLIFFLKKSKLTFQPLEVH